MAGPAERWGMSWDYNSLIHKTEDRGLVKQMAAAWMRTNTWITDVMGARGLQMLWGQNHQELLTGKL